MIYTKIYHAPCGDLILGDHQGRLCMCDWDDASRIWVRQRVSKMLVDKYAEGDTAVLDQAAEQLDEYFSGSRQVFDVPMVLCGTQFQHEVWYHLTMIKYGETKTYSGLAISMGHPDSTRAVASAARANAISILIPCHRLIGVGGKLTGYAGGIAAKKMLLELEGAEVY